MTTILPTVDVSEMDNGTYGPGPAAVCHGQVLHRRTTPAMHEFSAGVSFVWLDPDRPDELCGPHPLWSHRRRSIISFRASDYGDGSRRSLGEQVRLAVTPVLRRRPTGEIRMLTQVRRFGWLFNPITVFIVWDQRRPVAAVLEVSNTPWKERTTYPVALADHGNGRFVGSTPKTMHVSPFLDEAFEYEVACVLSSPDRIELSIDVVRQRGDQPILTTLLSVGRRPATRRELTKALFTPMPTHRVSLGIRWQALRLALKRVPFVPHPKRRTR